MQQKSAKPKVIITRVPFDLWQYVKHSSVTDDTSMDAIVNECLRKYKSQRENKLTGTDNLIK